MTDRNLQSFWNPDTRDLVIECPLHGPVEANAVADYAGAVVVAARHLTEQHAPPFGWSIAVHDGRQVRFDRESVRIDRQRGAVLFDAKTDEWGDFSCAISFEALEYFGFRRDHSDAKVAFEAHRAEIESIARTKVLALRRNDELVIIRTEDVRDIRRN